MHLKSIIKSTSEIGMTENHPVKVAPDDIGPLKSLIKETAARDLNEADTRHRVIDFIIHDFLKWPRNRVAMEEYNNPGYIDYVLKRTNGEDYLLVEAKREGFFFQIPIGFKADEQSCYIPISKLMTDKQVSSAMEQVRTYCFNSGCEFACITNGHEWIFFKAFERGKRWETFNAFVIRSLNFFKQEYTKAVNSLSYNAITNKSSLPVLLSSVPPKDRDIYYPKEKIPSYQHTITANRLASTLRPLANYYFGPIGDDDPDFMDRCYVLQREYDNAHNGLRTIIQDSLSPYLEAYNIQQLDETGKGGRFGGRLTKGLKRNKKGEVLVLFGGKGSGKSTFIKRLLYHKTPRWLQNHAVVSIIDLLNTPEEKRVIRLRIWSSLIQTLDVDKLLDADRSNLTSGLFADRFETAQKQELNGLSPISEAYNLRLNQLVANWKADHLYCAQRLSAYWQIKDRGIIVVIDNTDQYSAAMQDFCFTSAQEIANTLKCIAVISMREERFHNSKIHGLLDAFQNAGFHISSPKPAAVFRKRLQYVVGLLSNERRRKLLLGDTPIEIIDDCKIYLDILIREFASDKSPLNNFLTACAHGDTRLSLDLFRSFLLSGYTNVDEMISQRYWNFQVHQIIKPVMIPTRYFYEETLSDIPNIFQIRYNRYGSHFTSMRILRKLSKTMEASSQAYVSVSELSSYFIDTFNMADDFVLNLDILLKHGFVEANNRLDAFSESVDQIKITNYGLYMVKDLAFYFAYLDLICTDCGIFEENVCNYLTEAARDEYGLFLKGARLERVKVRLDRVRAFIAYLKQQELSERERFSLGMPEQEMFTFKTQQSFDQESERVIASAQRQRRGRSGGGRRY